MISIPICINKDNIASVFIVSPPHNVGRDEPNKTLIALLIILLYYKLLKSLVFQQ